MTKQVGKTEPRALETHLCTRAHDLGGIERLQRGENEL